ncbi:cytochrome c [Horticoccus luteus]|uniref:Cytochrome c n=1 Tax=Horticoccus luteus TaxID=2862869 RepID=A0A8F9XL93_9BACT|nr:cytochrome c [Horticoccus luteus]QYM78804.1 cytochrome c [Horticoccus luteus]
MISTASRSTAPRPPLRSLSAGLLLAPALLLALAGCDNMKDQANYRPLDPAPHFANGTAIVRPPAHTVARGSPPPGDPVTTGFHDGQPLAHSPVPFTRDLLLRGRDRFNIYCIVCHGEDGYGRGIVVRRGFPPPPSYHENRLRAAPDGHLFDVMTRGYGAMLPYSDRLSPQDRWAIVGYIRALQLSQHATLADVPATARAALKP